MTVVIPDAGVIVLSKGVVAGGGGCSAEMGAVFNLLLLPLNDGPKMPPQGWVWAQLRALLILVLATVTIVSTKTTFLILKGRESHEEINITFTLPAAWNSDDCVLHGHCEQVVFTTCMTVTAASNVFPVTV